jgi:branched-subunit amino acid ABC-type transport system permease component
MWKAVFVGIPAGIAVWFLASVFVAVGSQSACQAANTCAPLTHINPAIPLLAGLVAFALVMVGGWFLTRPVVVPPNKSLN